ncbi:vasoactive intestinal polypeptide receptor 2 [Amia ocellicauda]|uniref:vasoactive intestinal polypeptide receptor 2 n=1 Tax=Amia ocellicauda TaxID=2972642 RepID=UPI003463ED12
MRHILLTLVFLTFWCLSFVNGIHPECRMWLEIQREEVQCHELLKNQKALSRAGCRGSWDNISCWRSAEIGETVTVSCPTAFIPYFNKKGHLNKNCTANGWSETFPDLNSACGIQVSEVSEQKQLAFFTVVKTLYTLGHSLSLITLTTGSTILCLFRKLHCTRNYIHLNLFLSFILKAVSILVKDDILFPHSMDCTESSLIGCKSVLAFLQYCVMANFFWLLVEGIYLHTLLVVFSENRHFKIYVFVGWGIPAVVVIAWTMARVYLEDTGCWDNNENPIPWWIIQSPILACIVINFIIFISIIRILVQKLRCPDVGGNDQSQFKRLAKSTLLLIPLFGVHYIVFVYEEDSDQYKIFFELAIGSFQGLVVAVLYCFLNSEVQGELKRKWRSVCLNWYVSRDYKLHSSSISRNGSENTSQFHRNSRAQSFLQTETSIV